MKRFIRPHADAFAYAFFCRGRRRPGRPQFTKGSLLDRALKGDGGLTLRQFLRSSLLRRTPVIILDEPLANVDPDAVLMIEDCIADLRDTTVFVISHQGSERWEKAFVKRVRVG